MVNEAGSGASGEVDRQTDILSRPTAPTPTRSTRKTATAPVERWADRQTETYRQRDRQTDNGQAVVQIKSIRNTDTT
jgi:hypothetical protein